MFSAARLRHLMMWNNSGLNQLTNAANNAVYKMTVGKSSE